MRLITTIFVLGILLTSSCVGAQSDRSAIQQKKEYIVALEKQKSGQTMTYAHPVQMDVQKMKQILKGLNYLRKEGVLNLEDKGSVFQQVEIDRLARPLVSALAECTRSEYVRFASLNKKKKLWLLTTWQKTEGILFKDSQSKINLAFSHINSSVPSDDPISLQAEFSGKDPMTITRSNVKLTSQSALFERYVSGSGKSFPMWMTVTVEKPPATKTIPRKVDVSGPKPSSEKQVMETAPKMPEKSIVQKEVKEKLRYLKELLDEGLITEADYNTKKKLLLDKLK